MISIPSIRWVGILLAPSRRSAAAASAVGVGMLQLDGDTLVYRPSAASRTCRRSPTPSRGRSGLR